MEFDNTGRFIFTLFFFLWNIIEGFKIDTHYPHKLVLLYAYPLWRLFLLVAFVIGSMWSMSVSMMMGLALFFYFMDMQLLLYKEI